MSEHQPHLNSASKTRAQTKRMWLLVFTVMFIMSIVASLWLLNMSTLIKDAAKNNSDNGLINIIGDDFGYIMDTLEENDSKRQAALAALASITATSSEESTESEQSTKEFLNLLDKLASELNGTSTTSSVNLSTSTQTVSSTP